MKEATNQLILSGLFILLLLHHKIYKHLTVTGYILQKHVLIANTLKERTESKVSGRHHIVMFTKYILTTSKYSPMSFPNFKHL